MMITCNEKELSIEREMPGYELAKMLNLNDPKEALALFINGVPKDFSETISPGDQVQIFGFDDPKGKEVFWHSSAHLLAEAIQHLYPDAKPTIGPAIENGFYYDFANLSISEEDFPAIEKEMAAIAKENARPIKVIFKDKQEALKEFGKNPFKAELIRDLPEDAVLTGYRQGDFFDLCRGPHLMGHGKIKAIKLLKTSSAYWKGDPERESLTRIYGITFPDRLLLKDYLTLLEEAKKRDHRVLGTKLGLFSFFDVAPGMPIIEPNGMHIWNQLVSFWQELHKRAGYVEIKTPTMMDKSLWEQSGHWANYRENMYVSEIDKRIFAIKPMNCPACMLYFGSKRHSYRDLPLRIAEIGNVHRHELSGSLSGLLRVRTFHQDDAHIFMKPTDIESEILGVLKLVDEIYKTFGLEYRLELSTRPLKNTIGTDADWEMATKGLQGALEKWHLPYKINEGDGAFYGPKIDLHVKDTIGRSWQCGTIQLDMALPERFHLEYTDSDGEKKRPIMVHRALYGSMERFLAILIEHFAGKFPLWISPRPVRILTVADRHVAFAEIVKREVEKGGMLCEIDATSESMGKKVRLAQMDQVNYMLTIGDAECEHETVSLRSRDNVVHGEMPYQNFIEKALREFKNRGLTSYFSG